jgi:2-methylisocitrate lyase-like PEP mutase family enzyme
VQKTRRQFIRGTGVLAGGVLAQPLAAVAGGQAAAPRSQTASSAGGRLRKLIEVGEPVQCPVVHDVISAKLAVAHGFPMVLAGGGAISQDQFGMGDYGMLTITEMIELTARIADSVDVPIIADGDDGGGNPLNVIRAVRMLERAGAACVLIEDLYGAKHLTGLSNGNVLPTEAMVDKIHAAVDARREGGFAILARCDAPKEEAYDRVAAYAQAGADIIMVGAIPLQDGPRVVSLTKRPLLSTHMAPIPELKKNKVSIAVYSGPVLNAAIAAMDGVLREIKATGLPGSSPSVDRELVGRITDRDASVAAAKKYNALRR